ncbi:alpha/beta hydrolase, partial [Rhizobium ruizarguesonis]
CCLGHAPPGPAPARLVETTVKPTADEQLWFNQFRVGIWPNYFDSVQFSRDTEALNQYFRAMTPNTGPLDMDVVSNEVAKL